MSRYTSSTPRRELVEESTAPHPPDKCGVFGCERKAALLFAVVLKDGREISGAFGDFGFVKHGERGKAYVLKDGYAWVGWSTRCEEHYLRDLYGQRKGRWSCMASTDRISRDDVAAYVPNPAWDHIGTKAPRPEPPRGMVSAGDAVKRAMDDAA
jgi:hypothetical protein